MSVSLLYCEGGKKIDSRVLTLILGGLCQIKPVGSKYGFKEKVLISRELKPDTIIVNIRDIVQYLLDYKCKFIINCSGFRANAHVRQSYCCTTMQKYLYFGENRFFLNRTIKQLKTHNRRSPSPLPSPNT